jgi:hypothetical protein
MGRYSDRIKVAEAFNVSPAVNERMMRTGISDIRGYTPNIDHIAQLVIADTIMGISLDSEQERVNFSAIHSSVNAHDRIVPFMLRSSLSSKFEYRNDM